jgi:hypothetical protein
MTICRLENICRCKKLREKYTKFKKDMIWNGFIRGFIQPFPTVMIACMLNFKRLNTEASGETLAVVFIFPLFVLSMILPFFFHWWVYKHRFVLGDPEWSDVYGTLTDGLDVTNAKAIYWNVYQLYRFMLVNAILFFLSDHPLVQLGLILLMQLWVDIYIRKVRPFEKEWDTKSEIINQVFSNIYILVYVGLAVTDDEEPDTESTKYKMREYFTWGLSVILAIATLTSIAMLVLANVKVVKKVQEERKLEQKVIKAMLKKHGFDPFKRKEPLKWTFRQLFDYMIEKSNEKE